MDKLMELNGLTLHYHPQEHFIEGKFSGVAIFETGLQAMQLIIAAIEKYDCPYVFVDVTETLSMSTTSENFEFGTNLMDLGLSDDRYRWSIYYKTDPHIYEFLYDLAKMQGINYLYIDKDKASAMKWLMQEKKA